MKDGAGSVAPRREGDDDIDVVRGLLERGYAFRALARTLPRTRSFGCIPLLELDHAGLP